MEIPKPNAENDPETQFGNALAYYQVLTRNRSVTSNLFIVQESTGPTRAVRLHHPTLTWTFDPATVQYVMAENAMRSEERINEVNRTQAEEIAVLLNSVLPNEAQLRQMMQDGAEHQTG